MTPTPNSARLTDGEHYFSENLRERRIDEGLSQEALAEKMQELGFEGFNQMTVSRLEKGSRPVRLSEARALAFVLGTSTEQMSMPTDEVRAINDVWAAADEITALHDEVANFKIDVAHQRNVGQVALMRLDELVNTDELMLPPRVRHRLEESRKTIEQFLRGGHAEFMRQVERTVAEHFGAVIQSDGEHRPEQLRRPASAHEV